MRRRVRVGLAVLAAALIVYSVVHVGAYALQAGHSRNANEKLEKEVVAIAEISSEAATSPSHVSAHPKETAPITVAFDKLRNDNPDIVGWLYCEDTPINYPILQGRTNSFYLRRLPDKTYNINGSLFIDHRNAADLSDRNTVIYGHNMRDGSMFGTLENYGEQAYYQAHPDMWLLLPEQCYRLEVIAGCVVRSDSPLYQLHTSGEDAVKQVREAMAGSDFISEGEPEEDDLWVTLSTCSYAFDNARYVVLCRSVPIG